jgi:hypothetical protein
MRNMLLILRTAVTFLVVLFCVDYLNTFIGNAASKHLLANIETSVFRGYGTLESVQLFGSAVVFAAGGAVLVATSPRTRFTVWLAALLGVCYSVALFLFLPFLPLARYDHTTWWLLALASSQYIVPVIAAVAGGLAVHHFLPRASNVA